MEVAYNCDRNMTAVWRHSTGTRTCKAAVVNRRNTAVYNDITRDLDLDSLSPGSAWLSLIVCLERVRLSTPRLSHAVSNPIYPSTS